MLREAVGGAFHHRCRLCGTALSPAPADGPTYPHRRPESPALADSYRNPVARDRAGPRPPVDTGPSRAPFHCKSSVLTIGRAVRLSSRKVKFGEDAVARKQDCVSSVLAPPPLLQVTRWTPLPFHRCIAKSMADITAKSTSG